MGPVWLAAAVIATSARTTAPAPDHASLEYPVKASLLLNFAKFAEWPAGSPQAAAQAVSICVLGEDPFGATLDATVEGRTVGGRPVEIVRLRQTEGVEHCHVLFVSSSAIAQMAGILAHIRDAPVLTVGESGDFIERGGVIRLQVEDNHAAFSVDLGPTETSRLKLSSKLLNVARSVRGARR